MNIEILNTPRRFQLYGKSSAVELHEIAATGMRLMDELWRIVKGSQTPNTGINHWVYLPDGRMFVGVELQPGAPAPDGLESRQFELRRHLQHTHVGPYQALPEKWQQLKTELAARGEAICGPSLEIYGHHGDDPAKLETKILIGLSPAP
ncbi:MAG: GyrI-like domain-containing protein [Planctomycetaceae bacterium]|nr:GyrI-like domain-containing protein [Planctomycetaceae bacterium]